MKSPPPSSYESRMRIFKLNPSLKGLMEEMMPIEGIEPLLLPSQKYSRGRQPSTPSPGGELHWELWELSRLHTNAFIQPDEQYINPFIHHKVFFGLSEKFCRMKCCEWMAWMWPTHESTPSIHSASVTWRTNC